MPRDDAYLLDMKIACERALEFTWAATRDRLSSDVMMQFAVVHAVQIIGEAAGKISADFKTQHLEIPWLAITTMRHRLVHEYTKVDLDIVWKVVQIHIPELLRLLAPLIPPESPTTSPDGGTR
jgi:uncharacterized protein with HEPN domain